MIHQSLPRTLTTEKLAEWITSNSQELKVDRKEIPLTKEEIHDLEHKSSAASRAIDKINGRLKEIKTMFKKGTPEIDGIRKPVDITIPPTKGLDILNANREWADNILEQGYRVEETTLYMIPWPEESKMIFVDIEGREWPHYTRTMTPAEINQHKPLFKSTDKKRKTKVEEDIEEDDEEAGLAKLF